MEKFTMKCEEAALLIIDIQERLVPAMEYGNQVIDKTNILIKAAKTLNIPVMLTEQYPKGLGKTVSEIESDLQTDTIFEKMTFSGYTPELASFLDKMGKKKIIVTGMETHICVFQTVRALLENGFQVFVPADAVCSRAKSSFQNGLKLMGSMGAVITNTETVLFDLLKISGTKEFKELSKLIK